MSKKSNYQLEKAVWTNSDFDKMGWHDSIIYALSLIHNSKTSENELMLDIDYIFQWNKPEPPQEYFTFWVAPCTLIFSNVFNIQFEIDSGNSTVGEMEIDGINLLETISYGEDKFISHKWQIELQNGDIFFEADGYKQIVRRYPVYCEGQQIDFDERGGISFAKTPIEI